MRIKDQLQPDTEAREAQDSLLREGPTIEVAKKIYRLGSRIRLTPDQRAEIRPILASHYGFQQSLNVGLLADELDKSIASCLLLETFDVDPISARTEFIASSEQIRSMLPMYLDMSKRPRFTFHHFVHAARNSAIQLHLSLQIGELGIAPVTKSRNKYPHPSDFYVPAKQHDDRITELFGISRVLKALYADPELSNILPQMQKNFLYEMTGFETTTDIYRNSTFLLPDMSEQFNIQDLLIPTSKQLENYKID